MKNQAKDTSPMKTNTLILFFALAMAGCDSSTTETLPYQPTPANTAAEEEMASRPSPEPVAEPTTEDAATDQGNEEVNEGPAEPEASHDPVVVEPAPVEPPTEPAPVDPEESSQQPAATAQMFDGNREAARYKGLTVEAMNYQDALKAFDVLASANKIRVRYKQEAITRATIESIRDFAAMCPEDAINLCVDVLNFAASNQEAYLYKPEVEAPCSHGVPMAERGNCWYTVNGLAIYGERGHSAFFSPIIHRLSPAERVLWESQASIYRAVNIAHYRAHQCGSGSTPPHQMAIGFWPMNLAPIHTRHITIDAARAAFNLTKTGRLDCDSIYEGAINAVFGNT